MFTGLIQTVGKLRPLGTEQVQITCDSTGAKPILSDLAIGDSVAVDGVCLTVTKILAQGFVAAVSPETLGRTTLGQESAEVYVNLEPSLRAGSKLGGHFVTGHIDGIGYLDTSIQTANAWEISFRVTDPRVARYIVPKGSIAVNGISLTVADCNSSGSWFKAAVIPLTYADTNLRYLQSGSPVNLEGDVLGKYVEKFLRLGSSIDAVAIGELERSLQGEELAETEMGGISPTFLAEHGYL